MEPGETQRRAVEQLQGLGLKEYEAEALVALIRLGDGTAKEVSEVSEVPRTRVYDAVRVLEAKGLVEVQHSSPQRFRAVPVREALATLERQYEDRFESLERDLQTLEETSSGGNPPPNEVWTLTDKEAIANRIERLIGEAENEVIVVVGDDGRFDTGMTTRLEQAVERDIAVAVGALDAAAAERMRRDVPDVGVFTTDLGWLEPEEGTDEASVSVLVLVDRDTLLVSAVNPNGDGEHAVFGEGFANGLVVIARRILLTGQAGELLDD
jgi:sugar-specific transcriptional regulator TrmB